MNSKYEQYEQYEQDTITFRFAEAWRDYERDGEQAWSAAETLMEAHPALLNEFVEWVIFWVCLGGRELDDGLRNA